MDEREMLATKLDEVGQSYQLAPWLQELLREAAATLRQPPALSVEGLRQQVEALVTTRDDFGFTVVRRQDVLALLVAPAEARAPEQCNSPSPGDGAYLYAKAKGHTGDHNVRGTAWPSTPAEGPPTVPDTTCRDCGEDLRWSPAEGWLDRETHAHCGPPRDGNKRHAPAEARAPHQGICAECGCQTGGGTHCYVHAPYTVWPLKDGSFRSYRGGLTRIWLDASPTLESEARAPQEAPCSYDHVWTNQFGDDWYPDDGVPCDCGERLSGGRIGASRPNPARAPQPAEPTLSDRIRNEPELMAAYTLGVQNTARQLSYSCEEQRALEVDNHHNALTCPYCNPDGLVLRAPQPAEPPTREAECERAIIECAESWQRRAEAAEARCAVLNRENQELHDNREFWQQTEDELKAQNATLTTERDAARAAFEQMERINDGAQRAFNVAMDHVAALTAALRTYGQHHANCAVFVMTVEGRRPSGRPCDCGLMAALAASSAPTAQEKE